MYDPEISEFDEAYCLAQRHCEKFPIEEILYKIYMASSHISLHDWNAGYRAGVADYFKNSKEKMNVI